MQNPTHATIDLFKCPSEPLKDIITCRDYLKKCVSLMNMSAVGEPNVFYFRGNTDLESGVTGTQIIAESLISIHTYGEHGAVYVDLFSCNSFDQLKLYKFTVKYFQSEKSYLNMVHRTSINEVDLS